MKAANNLWGGMEDDGNRFCPSKYLGIERRLLILLLSDQA